MLSDMPELELLLITCFHKFGNIHLTCEEEAIHGRARLFSLCKTRASVLATQRFHKYLENIVRTSAFHMIHCTASRKKKKTFMMLHKIS
jgi:hypothetical protein